MESSVEQTITQLREVVGAKTNAELSRKLGIDQSTISAWRARGRVPKRFVDFLDEDVEAKPQIWAELQERAQTIALVRFTLLMHDTAVSGDVDKAMTEFMDLKAFWLVMHRAVHELRLKMENLKLDITAAQALLLQEDLRDPSSTKVRVTECLAEDIKDNSWLAAYE